MDPEAVNLDYHTANVVTIELGMSSNQEVQDGGSWILGYHLANLNSSFLTIALASTNFGMDTYCLPRIVNIENRKARKDTTNSIIFCTTNFQAHMVSIDDQV